MDLAWNDYVTIVLLLIGCFFALTGAIGVLRMPDFYTRLHPAGKSDTLGQFLILTGLAFQLIDADFNWSNTYASDPWMCFVRIVLIIIVIIITAPTATHAITKAARLDGLEPWTLPVAEADETGAEEDTDQAGETSA